ncbi:aldehyde dehydrogenase [Mesorhizobium sp. L2C089B000]|nr:aldehyde dehydrogenase [Mesorhizobium sp. L2C089B000]
MPDAAEDQRMAVANYGILDGAIDLGKRTFERQCAACKGGPACTLVASLPLEAASTSKTVGNRDLICAQHIHAEVPMPVDGCPCRGAQVDADDHHLRFDRQGMGGGNWTFKDDAEALAIANDTLYGLGAGVWTRDSNRAYRFGRAIQAGRVWTNCYHAYPAHAAFGGYKQSGIGRETHKMMLDHYQQTKNMLVSYSPKKLGFF